MSVVYNLFNYFKSWCVKEDIKRLNRCIVEQHKEFVELQKEIEILKAQLKFHESIFLKIGMKLQMVGTDWMQKFVAEEIERVIEHHYPDTENSITGME